MAVGTGVGVDEGEIVGVVVEVLAVDDIVVGTGSSAGVEVKEGDSVPSTVVVAIGVGVGVGSVGVDVQAISANTKAGTARTCHPVRFKWSRRLAVAKSNSPILFLHSQRDIKDKHSILEHRGLHSHLGFPVCSHGLSRLLLPHQPLEGKAGVYNHEAAQAIPSNWASLASRASRMNSAPLLGSTLSPKYFFWSSSNRSASDQLDTGLPKPCVSSCANS